MTTYKSGTVTTTRGVSPAQTDVGTTVEVDTTYTNQADFAGHIYIGVLVLFVLIGIIAFIKSVRSRKYYKCSTCGESFRSENMESMTCKVCGANLEETDDSNITDKTK